MGIELTECIDKMDGAFYFLESKYSRFVDVIHSDGEISFFELHLYIDKCGPFSIFSYLKDALDFWNDKGRIVSEVNKNLPMANGYIAYVETVFKRHYNFISELFPQAINEYFSNFDKYPDLEILSINPSIINGIDLIDFIRVQFVHLFAEFEYLFNSVYPNYNKLLTQDVAEVNVLTEARVARKIITDFTDSQIEYLYSEMKDVFISCDLLAFRCMLQQGTMSDAKVFWINKAQNDMINKATLIEFVNRIVIDTKDSAIINNFIIQYFDTGDDAIDVKRKRKNLNSARNSMMNSGGTKSSAILNDILNKVLKK